MKTKSKSLIFLILWLGGSFAGMDATLFSVVLPDTLKALQPAGGVNAVSYFGSYILSAFLVGWLTGGLLMGYIADRFGRVKACALSILIYACFTGLSAFAETPSWLLVYRFLTGIGVGGEMLAISVLLAEHFSTNARAVALGALITSYQVGVLLSGAIVSIAGDWRSAFIWGSAPALLALIAYFLLPESPAWLQQKSGAGKRVSAEFWNVAPKRELAMGAVAFGCLLIGYWASLSWVPTWIQSLLSSENTSGNEKQVAMMLHGGMAVIGCCLAGVLANSWGRVPVILGSYTCATAVSIAMFLGNQTFSNLIYYEYALLGLCIGIAQAVMYIYLPELFITAIRARAVGFCLNSGRIVTALAVFFVGYLTVFLGGYDKALCFFAMFYMVGAFVSYFAPETNARALPE